MTKVTKFQYPLEDKLLPVLDALSKRCTHKTKKQDTVLLFEGKEGTGKTTYSIAVGYYVAEKTKRKFTSKNVFFDIDAMLDFAQTTKEQILIWDEPALAALSTDYKNKMTVNLKRLLMTCRKLRHFIMINITYFNRFDYYLIAERPNGMIKIYENKKTGQLRFTYIKEKNLIKLWEDWQRNRKKNYFRYGSKMIRGAFPDVLNEDREYNVLSEFDIEDYEKRKSEAIMSIGNEKKDKNSLKIFLYQYLIWKIAKEFKIKFSDVADIVTVHERTITTWKDNPQKYPEILKKTEDTDKWWLV